MLAKEKAIASMARSYKYPLLHTFLASLLAPIISKHSEDLVYHQTQNCIANFGFYGGVYDT